MPSPSVNRSEIDRSTRVPETPGVYTAIVIPAKKGPVNVPTFVTSEEDFLKTFCVDERISPSDHMSHWSADTYLSEGGNRLWVVRAANTTGLRHAGIRVKFSSGQSGAADFEPFATPAAGVGANDDGTDVSYITSGDGAVTNSDLFLLYALNPGAWGNNLSVDISSRASDLEGETNAQLRIRVYMSGTRVETHLVSLDNSAKDGYGRSLYIDDVLSRSEYIRGDQNNTGATTGGVTSLVKSQVTSLGMFTRVASSASADGAGEWKRSSSTSIVIFTGASGAAFDAIDDLETGDTIAIGDATYTLSANSPAVSSGTFTLAVTEAGTAPAENAAANVVVTDVGDPINTPTTRPSFAYGNDGGDVADSHLITAWETLASPEEYPVTLIMDGGQTGAGNQTEMIDLCSNSEKRQDSFAILSTPRGNMAEAIAHAQQSHLRGSGDDKSFAAMYWPWVQIYDKFNDRRIWVSPDGHVAARFSQVGTFGEIWQAVSGLRRGAINVLDVEYRTDKANRDLLFDTANINNIRFRFGRGVTIHGQRTLLSRPSALQAINVRMVLNYIGPDLEEFLENFLEEPNTVRTRLRITNGMNSYMNRIATRGGVYWFQVICDGTNNKQIDIDNERINVDLSVRPTRTASEINFRIIVESEGVSVE